MLELFDVFISHASEDKESFVRPLAERLRSEHVEVWYDEFSLELGDSLQSSIDHGLARSRFGIVVLSPSFFAKRWPKREFAGLVAREMIGGHKVILPIWHGVGREEVCSYSPPLADLVAISSDQGLEEVVARIFAVVRPQGSPLVVARDELIKMGLEPPVVTDEWWLDVVEASHREPCWGAIPQQEHWGRWTFPLPWAEDARSRGLLLALTALQLDWTAEAEDRRITQVTHPDEVVAFIRSQPGLEETCKAHPRILATYAPQLTIRGFGGPFEEIFDAAIEEDRGRGKVEEEYGLRDPRIEEADYASVAGQFVMGDIFGPECKAYDIVDYLVWLLSDDSQWLPPVIRRVLTQGIKEWGVWIWTGYPEEYRELDISKRHLYEAIDRLKPDALPKAVMADIHDRFEATRRLLDLSTDTEVLVERFMAESFIQDYHSERRGRRTRKK